MKVPTPQALKLPCVFEAVYAASVCTETLGPHAFADACQILLRNLFGLCSKIFRRIFCCSILAFL